MKLHPKHFLGCFITTILCVSLYGIIATKTHVVIFIPHGLHFQPHLPHHSQSSNQPTLNCLMTIICFDNICWPHILKDSIDNSIPCPPKFISSATTSSTTTTDSPNLVPNPDYEVWVRQDKLIFCVIISIISKVILVHVVGLHTSRDVWITLDKMFATQSKARMVQIRY
jgi:hypothetical protein